MLDLLYIVFNSISLIAGNLARRLLSEQAQLFSDIAGIPLFIIETYYTLYVSLVSRRARIDPDKYAQKVELVKK